MYTDTTTYPDATTYTDTTTATVLTLADFIEYLRQADLNRKIEQAVGRFVSYDVSNPKPTRIRACAMGAVWALVTHQRPSTINREADQDAAEWSGRYETLVTAKQCFAPNCPTSNDHHSNIVIHLNDIHQMSFGEIADYLETHMLKKD